MRETPQTDNNKKKSNALLSYPPPAHVGPTHLAAGLEEVSDLGHGHEVGDVRFARGRCAPVDFEGPFLQDGPNPLLPDHLVQPPRHQLCLLLWGHVGLGRDRGGRRERQDTEGEGERKGRYVN